MSEENPEIGQSVDVGGIATNYHRIGSGEPVFLIHGSGPGVSAWANWRLILPELSEEFDVAAPDIVGFGFTDRPDGFEYNMANWRKHLLGFADAIGLEKFSLVGNSFGGGLAISMAVNHPERVDKLILMGSAGISFPLTDGLDKVWGYEPSLENMEDLMKVFAWNPEIGANKDLAKLRYEASIRPGFHESFSQMFPTPRQNGIEDLATPEDQIRQITAPTLIVHGRDDQVIPLDNAYRFHQLIDNSQLHVYGQCGHWTQIEKAAEFTRLVASFLHSN
ncbi:alpha/beta fold hydrolase [Granulicoccus sp. GXG6511]|uniref:alpha/beta fold hydrolase n=1 Tax=Granulicoccus sp. GXG6511 TaxID=3381351 RepID=UPI003D7E9B9E